MKRLLKLLAASLVTGCSAQAVYENIQIERRTHCITLVLSKYDECLQPVDISYTEYQLQRETLVDE